MFPVQQFLQRLEREGLAISVNGDQLRLGCPKARKPPPWVQRSLRDHRATIVAHLQQPSGAGGKVAEAAVVAPLPQPSAGHSPPDLEHFRRPENMPSRPCHRCGYGHYWLADGGWQCTRCDPPAPVKPAALSQAVADWAGRDTLVVPGRVDVVCHDCEHFVLSPCGDGLGMGRCEHGRHFAMERHSCPHFQAARDNRATGFYQQAEIPDGDLEARVFDLVLSRPGGLSAVGVANLLKITEGAALRTLKALEDCGRLWRPYPSYSVFAKLPAAPDTPQGIADAGQRATLQTMGVVTWVRRG